MIKPVNMIKELVESGLTQPALAKKAKVSQPTISRILNGQVEPSFSTYKAIQKIYFEAFGGPFRDSDSAA